MLTTIIAMLLLIGAILVLVALIRINIYRVRPDEVAVFTGTSRVVTDPESGASRTVGFRIVRGGSAFRIPVIERVDRLSLAVMSVQIALDDVRDAIGRVWSLELLVNARIAPAEAGLMRAIERFLGMPSSEVTTIIANTAEARLRNLLVTYDLTDDEGWAAIEMSLARQLADDLERLGIVVDNLIFAGPPRPSYTSAPNGGAPDMTSNN